MAKQKSSLWNWRELEQAASKRWLLTTKQVQELTGAIPDKIPWRCGSFTFRQAKTIIAGEQTWLVRKRLGSRRRK